MTTSQVTLDYVFIKRNKQNMVSKTNGFKELSTLEFNRLKEYSKAISENAVEEIKSGFIKPTPSAVSKPCEYCAYMQVCFRNSNKIQYRNSSKVDLDSFKVVEDEGI